MKMSKWKNDVISLGRALRVLTLFLPTEASRMMMMIMMLIILSTPNVVINGFVPKLRPLAISVSPCILLARRHKSFITSPRNSSLWYQTPNSILSSSSPDTTMLTGSNHLAYSSSTALFVTPKMNANNNKKQTHQRRQRTFAAIPKMTAVALAAIMLICWKRQALLSFIRCVKNEWLVTTLLRLNAAGPLGLVLYTVAFLLWEMTLGMTTPVEVASGMAFGAAPAIITNAIGKTGGAMITFFLAQHIFAERLYSRIHENEMLSLMQESIQEMPLRVALLCRFSPLPEFVKNAGMGVMASSSSSSSSNSSKSRIPQCFFASLILHGFFFTCLWSCLGAETARVLVNGQPPSTWLKTLITGATWIGVAAPVLIGIWIKSLKDKKSNSKKSKQSNW
jgi:uncharacterized membrane protein YdjX (TVP38/TMEM64 family)